MLLWCTRKSVHFSEWFGGILSAHENKLKFIYDKIEIALKLYKCNNFNWKFPMRGFIILALVYHAIVIVV